MVKRQDQQNEIYTALQASIGKNITLKYPRTGDFTSAFLIANIDEESTQEAIVFYEAADTVNATMTLRINVLDQNDGACLLYTSKERDPPAAWTVKVESPNRRVRGPCLSVTKAIRLRSIIRLFGNRMPL